MNTPFWGPDFDSLASTDPEIADVVLGGSAIREPGNAEQAAEAAGRLTAAYPRD